MNVSELYRMAAHSPDQAHTFVSTLVEELINKKIESLQQNVESSQFTEYFGPGKLHCQSLSDLTKHGPDRESSLMQSCGKTVYPMKSPASIQPLFRRQQAPPQKIPLNDLFQKTHRLNQSLGQNTLKNEHFQSPNPERNSTNYITTRSGNKSPGLCTFCKQTMNISTCDNIEKSQFLETSQKKQRNMGYFSYNFVYTLAAQAQRDNQGTAPIDQKKEITQPDDQMVLSQLRNSKSQPMKNSATQIQSFDFDLTISQAPKDSVVLQAKERQFSELCLSQVVSHEHYLKSKTNPLVDKSIQTTEQAKHPFPQIKTVQTQEYQQESVNKYFSNSNQSIIELGSKRINGSFSEHSQSISPSMDPIESTSPKTYMLAKMNQETVNANLQQNLAMLSNLIVPHEERERKQTQFLQSRSSIQRDLLSDPLELLNDTVYRRLVTQNTRIETPIHRILDQLDVRYLDQRNNQ